VAEHGELGESPSGRSSKMAGLLRGLAVVSRKNNTRCGGAVAVLWISWLVCQIQWTQPEPLRV